MWSFLKGRFGREGKSPPPHPQIRSGQDAGTTESPYRPFTVIDVGRSHDLIAGSPYGKHTDGCSGWYWNGEG
jgi:hypothetical protein